MSVLKVYIGYDRREDLVWQVCRHSLSRHASIPLAIFPLRQEALRELGLYTRPHDRGAATEFSLTRFLAPYIAAHDGWTVFVDCDFLFTTDIAGLLRGRDTAKAVHVVQHDYVPRAAHKMDGQVQTAYPRKNWSSFMLFNGAHPAVKALTPEVVNREGPAFLHRLSWVEDGDIGALDLGWNFLEGEYAKPAHVPPAIHYTNGGPWFANCQGVDFADLWTAECDLYRGTIERN